MNTQYSIWSWSWFQIISVICVLAGLGYLLNYNFNVAAAKARDWERKQYTKEIHDKLAQSFLVATGTFPPDDGNGHLKGCGDALCPIADGEGTNCMLGSQWPNTAYSCEDTELFRLRSMPDLPQTVSHDAPKYKRLSTKKAVVEVCLERQNDPEAKSIDTSLIGWNKQECPTQAILIYPDNITAN